MRTHLHFGARGQPAAMACRKKVTKQRRIDAISKRKIKSSPIDADVEYLPPWAFSALLLCARAEDILLGQMLFYQFCLAMRGIDVIFAIPQDIQKWLDSEGMYYDHHDLKRALRSQVPGRPRGPPITEKKGLKFEAAARKKLMKQLMFGRIEGHEDTYWSENAAHGHQFRFTYTGSYVKAIRSMVRRVRDGTEPVHRYIQSLFDDGKFDFLGEFVAHAVKRGRVTEAIRLLRNQDVEELSDMADVQQHISKHVHLKETVNHYAHADSMKGESVLSLVETAFMTATRQLDELEAAFKGLRVKYIYNRRCC